MFQVTQMAVQMAYWVEKEKEVKVAEEGKSKTSTRPAPQMQTIQRHDLNSNKVRALCASGGLIDFN